MTHSNGATPKPINAASIAEFQDAMRQPPQPQPPPAPAQPTMPPVLPAGMPAMQQPQAAAAQRHDGPPPPAWQVVRDGLVLFIRQHMQPTAEELLFIDSQTVALVGAAWHDGFKDGKAKGRS